MAETVDVCPLSDLPSGARRKLVIDDLDVLVVNCDGQLFAIEDVCSHDDGPLDDGPLDCAAGTIECPRHGSLFDLRTGKPKTLPAYSPVETFPVEVEAGTIYVIVD